MNSDLFVIPDNVNDATAEALQRMYAARERVRQRYFSDEAMANEYPADAPEFLGIMKPELMRDAPRRRAVG
ncbi:hypothetical protein [Longimicrobium sp.]|uniref:hypothetical protein n=1 Tax=Longimicrobium sp. TaxID=2029185 RepID=UPI002E2ED533|nr:hypothetical protein [Longimicrobium sp.]HEX6037956.1 hypothetical protein [Longimicrobium sp.]